MTSRTRAGLVVLLGAGASIDAGLPDVEGLTDAVYRGFDDTAEQLRVLEQLALIEPSARSDYEALFKWMDLAMRHAGFSARLGLGGLQRTIVEMTRAARRSIVGVLRRPINQAAGAYLSALAQLKPWAIDGPLDVFTLNYDLCVENACRAAGFKVSTGFENGEWAPASMKGDDVDVALYKLHGSMNWFSDDTQHGPDELASYLPIVEGSIDDRRMPQLILGPGFKVQADDPFFSLLNCLHEVLRRAALCVVIGYGWRDAHITKRIDRARDAGMHVLDVNPEPTPLWFGERGVGLSSDVGCTSRRYTAREVLSGTLLFAEVEKALGSQAR